MQNFTPSELEVKLAGNRLSVSGKHEQRADVHGYVAREFHREFEIPEVCQNAMLLLIFANEQNEGSKGLVNSSA